ncbi:hypothetical protein DL767_011484 [Monosporascus sp. MG133]|nr:hypothetical protein DL767_011484 [Monosporascus sp. MG133]
MPSRTQRAAAARVYAARVTRAQPVTAAAAVPVTALIVLVPTPATTSAFAPAPVLATPAPVPTLTSAPVTPAPVFAPAAAVIPATPARPPRQRPTQGARRTEPYLGYQRSAFAGRFNGVCYDPVVGSRC